MSEAKFISFASVISEIQQSDLFMTVKARILETPKANLNGCSVTEAFVDNVISNEERYVGLPLYADIHALKGGKYNRLGHLYDSRTGEFHSTQIGSFYQFEKEEFEGGAYLVGYARIPKRDKALSKAIAELFADGALKFSFEIACVDYSTEEDGTFVIDASENNYLEGTAIVTFPACEDAVALEFVAQREADDTRKGDEKMAEVEKLVAEETEATTTKQVEQPEVETAEQAESVEETETAAEEKAEEETACIDKKADEETACTDKKAEEESAACKKEQAEEENAESKQAEVLVHEEHYEAHTVNMYDVETGKDYHQTVTVDSSVCQTLDGNVVESDDGISIAEAGGDNDPGETQPETPAEPATPAAEPAAPAQPAEPAAPAVTAPPANEAEDAPILPGETKKTAEELIAELTQTVMALAEEVKSLKEQRVVASTVTAEVNPFTDTIVPEGNKYSLLEPETKREHFTLI